MTVEYDGWSVHVNETQWFAQRQVELVIYRPLGDGATRVVLSDGSERRLDGDQRLPDDLALPRVPRGSLLALRDALNRVLGEAPDTKAETVLREALQVERDRVDKTLSMLSRRPE